MTVWYAGAYAPVGTTVITVSGTGQPGLMSSALVVELEQLNNESCNYSCTSSWWWMSTPETCRVAYRNIINWIQLHLFGQLLKNYENSIFRIWTGFLVAFVVENTFLREKLQRVATSNRSKQQPVVLEREACKIRSLYGRPNCCIVALLNAAHIFLYEICSRLSVLALY